jgi:hypothetical protein
VAIFDWGIPACKMDEKLSKKYNVMYYYYYCGKMTRRGGNRAGC